MATDRERIFSLTNRLSMLADKKAPTDEDGRIALKYGGELVSIMMNAVLDIRDHLKSINDELIRKAS